MTRFLPKADHLASADRLLSRLRRLMRRADEECLENFFTECIGAAINDDQRLSKALLREVCASTRIGGILISTSTVRTYRQVKMPNGAIADLLLEVSDASSHRTALLVLEHKLAAKLSVGQLEKYLESPVACVAAISRYNLPIPPAIRENPRYKKPVSHSHFMWPDLFPLVDRAAKRKGAGALSRALLGFFEDLKFEPPSKEIGKLRHQGTSDDKRLRQAFAGKWNATKSALKGRWRNIHAGSQAQLYCENPSASGRLAYVLLDPLAPNNMLRIRLNCRNRRAQSQIAEELGKARPLKKYSRISKRGLKRTYGTEPVLDVEVPLRYLAPAGSSPEQQEANIRAFVVPIINRAHGIRAH